MNGYCAIVRGLILVITILSTSQGSCGEFAEVASTTGPVMFDNHWNGIEPGTSRLEEVENALGPPDERREGARYGGLTDVTIVSYRDIPASIFLVEDRVVLVIVAIAGVVGVPKRLSEWRKGLGNPEAVLPSRQGKNHRVYLYADRGVAAVAEADIIELVEFFEPMTVPEYRTNVYSGAPTWKR